MRLSGSCGTPSTVAARLAGDPDRPSMDMISSKLCDSLSLKLGIEILFLRDLAAQLQALEVVAFNA
ncbi:MAG: hypothetical protein LBU32_12805 [Clostridiales bacterium]|jgi:hypothetical protein|nr:hypothetical protein [Clostridiales bacterium]